VATSYGEEEMKYMLLIHSGGEALERFNRLSKEE
jgi:hypothetical protein